MEIRETDTIDIERKGLPDEGVDVVLEIVDVATTADVAEREALFFAKLKNYGLYIASQPPTRTRIRVLHRTLPTETMSQVRSICPRGDEAWRTEVLFQDYDAAMAAIRSVPRASRRSEGRPPRPTRSGTIRATQQKLRKLFGR